MTETMFRVKDPNSGRSFMVPIDVEAEGKKLVLSFDYCPPLLAEVKAMQGAHWCGYDKVNPRKVWTVDNSPRNLFRMDYLKWAGKKADGTPVVPGTHDPYARYSLPLQEHPCPPRPFKQMGREPETREFYAHQPHGVNVVMTRRQCILVWEMGTGKTLTILRAMELAQEQHGWKDEDFWFVCKNGALFQVIMDFKEWGSAVKPRFMSYETLTSTIASWPKGKPAPKFVVFDESTQIKNATAQRSVAALHLANSMRAEHGPDAFIVCMSGSPAPKNPVDWWHQVEVVCPGFLREGDANKFKRTLAIIEKQETDGGSYPKLVAWLDDERKCKKCGQFKEAMIHDEMRVVTQSGHQWEPSVNEVKRIYARLAGLVDVKFKRDCLSLPKKVRRIIRCQPSQSVLRAAKLVAAAARGAAHALVLLRELSDGFQYQDVAVDQKQCPDCAGSGTMLLKFDPENPIGPPSDEAISQGRLEEREADCDRCRGRGDVDVVERQTVRVQCPKDDVLEELIDEHADVGRLAVYAGFTGSVDRVVDVFVKNKWHVIRVDARGWHTFSPMGEKHLPMEGPKAYEQFRYGQKDFEKVAFVAQASTAGHGLNFDCCPTLVFYSNDFHWENRTQAGERNARGKIADTLKAHGREHMLEVDIVHLPADQFVLDNHEKKRKLQSLTLGEVQAALDAGIASSEAR